MKEMIPDFKTYLKESVWMDIHKQSIGDIDRKEDDINLLDQVDLYNYFLREYEYARHISDKHLINQNYFYIPAFMMKSKMFTYHVIYKEKGDNTIEKVYVDIGSNVNKLFTEYLRQNYNIDDNDGFGMIEIYPKEGKIDNKFVINTFDDILKFTNSTVVKKRENV